MTVRAVRQLLATLVVLLGLLALVALLYDWAGNASEHRAFSIVFLIGGASLLIFGLLTNGAERRAWGMGPQNLLVRGFRVRPDESIAINFSGALGLCGAIAIVLGFVFDATMR